MKDKKDNCMNNQNKIENARIENIGLFYCGHGNRSFISIDLAGKGWGISLQIPLDDADKLIKMFKNEPVIKDIDTGFYLHELKGVVVRLLYDGNSFNSKVIGIGDVFAKETSDFLLCHRVI